MFDVCALFSFFSALILSPTLAAEFCNALDISCSMGSVLLMIARSSAKSRSVSLVDFHGMPKCGLFIDCLMMKSTTSKNRRDERIHLCLTPVIISKKSVCPLGGLMQHCEL